MYYKLPFVYVWHRYKIISVASVNVLELVFKYFTTSSTTNAVI